MEYLVSFIIIIAVLCGVGRIVGCQNDVRCSEACGVQKYDVIRTQCFCKTEKGYDHNEKGDMK